LIFEEIFMFKPEVESLVPAQAVSRRGFVKTSLGVGFAASVLPVSAQAIKTSADGLDAGEVALTVDGQKVPVYIAKPKDKTNLPIVVVVSEIFGVHEYIADTARRFAKAGYMAVAPDYFVRQGDPTSFGTIAELVEKVISKVPDAQVMKDTDAAVAYAAANGGDRSRLAITGFCWGGRITWLYTAHAKVNAGVAWYGRLQGTANALQTSNPIELVGKLNAPVLGLYGGKDTGIPMAHVEAMQAALAGADANAAAKKSKFTVYPEAPHAFHADYRPSFRKEAAEDGWAQCLAWFKANGVA
jgi:carboxymethylenebutenolidase